MVCVKYELYSLERPVKEDQNTTISTDAISWFLEWVWIHSIPITLHIIQLRRIDLSSIRFSVKWDVSELELWNYSWDNVKILSTASEYSDTGGGRGYENRFSLTNSNTWRRIQAASFSQDRMYIFSYDGPIVPKTSGCISFRIAIL